MGRRRFEVLRKEAKKVVISDIVEECGRMFAVAPKDILSPARFHFVTRARFALCLALSIRGHSTNKIGQWIGRDHTTVMNAIRKGEIEMDRNPEYARKVFALVKLISTPTDVHTNHRAPKAVAPPPPPPPKPEAVKAAAEKVPSRKDERRLKQASGDWGCEPGVPIHLYVEASLRYASKRLLMAIEAARV